MATSYTYDKCNRLTNLVNGSLSSFIYTLYADGMRKTATETITRPDYVADVYYINYEYDNLNRLTCEVANDQAGNMNNGYSSTYTYDLSGSRLSRTQNIYENGTYSVHDTQYYYNDVLHPECISKEVYTFTSGSAMGDRSSPIYATFTSGQGMTYHHTQTKESISAMRAAFMGLPTKWAFVALAACLGLILTSLFIPLALSRLRRKAFKEGYVSRPKFSLLHRGISLMLSVIFMIGLMPFKVLADQSHLYNTLENRAEAIWGANDKTIWYCYDANGSLIYKYTTDSDVAEENLETDYDEKVTYEYNLQNRLETATTTDGSTTTVVKYVNNDAGIRVKKIDDLGGANEVVTSYLIDPDNHTGYAQVLQETTGTATTYYTIGDVWHSLDSPNGSATRSSGPCHNTAFPDIAHPTAASAVHSLLILYVAGNTG